MGERLTGGIDFGGQQVQAPSNEGAGQQHQRGGNIFTHTPTQAAGVSQVSDHFRVDPLNQAKGDADWFARRARNGSGQDFLTPLQQVGYLFHEFGMPHVIISWLQEQQQVTQPAQKPQHQPDRKQGRLSPHAQSLHAKSEPVFSE